MRARAAGVRAHAGGDAWPQPRARAHGARTRRARAACGLYYLAELCEEYTSLTKRVVYWAILAIEAEHALLLAFERLPLQLVLFGMVAHGCYFQLLKSFPFLQLASPAFLLSCCAVVLSTYGWLRHFAADYHSPA